MNNISSPVWFWVAVIVYALVASSVPDNVAVGLSVVLVLGALEINSKSGRNFLSTIGLTPG